MKILSKWRDYEVIQISIMLQLQAIMVYYGAIGLYQEFRYKWTLSFRASSQYSSLACMGELLRRFASSGFALRTRIINHFAPLELSILL